MRQLDQFIVLTLLAASLLDRGLRQVALLQQAQCLDPLLDLHPFGQPPLPVAVRSVDGGLCGLHFDGLRVLQAIHLLQLRRRHTIAQLVGQLRNVRVTQRGQLHLAPTRTQPDTVRELDRTRQAFGATLGQLQNAREGKRLQPSTSSNPLRAESSDARSRMPCIR